MKRNLTEFVWEKRHFEELRGKDGENVRARVTLRDPALGRRLCTGDVDPKAPFPGTPLSTSYLVTGDARKDRAARRAAAMRLEKKAEPYYTKKNHGKRAVRPVFSGIPEQHIRAGAGIQPLEHGNHQTERKAGKTIS